MTWYGKVLYQAEEELECSKIICQYWCFWPLA
jgi:hypothetical protein